MGLKLQQQWQQLQQQWQANPRLRVLAAVVVLILLISLLQSFQQWQNQAKQESQRHWQRLQDVKQLSQESYWHQHALEAQQALQQLEQKLWHADSEGQAQAKFRDVLQQALNRHGLSSNRISLTSIPTDDGRLLQVRANLAGDYQAGPWQEFVFDVTHQYPAIYVENDSINRTNQRRNSYRLSMHAWFELEAKQ